MTKSGRLNVALIARFVLTAIIPILVIGSLSQVYLTGHIRDSVESKNLLLANSMAREISITLKQTQVILDQVSVFLTDHIKQYEGHDDFDAVNELLDSVVVESDFFESIYLLDANGIVTHAGFAHNAVTRRDDFIGIDFSRKPFFLTTITEQKRVWSDAMLSSITGQMSLTLSMPFDNGALVANFSIEHLHSMIQQVRIRDEVTAAILDRQGVLIFHPDVQKASEKRNLSHIIPMVKPDATPISTFEYSFEGETYLGSVARIPETQWVALVSQNIMSATKTVRSIRDLFILGMLIGILISASLAVAMAGQLTRPLREFSQTTQAVAAGNYQTTIMTQPYQELESLADNFRSMSRAIQDRERELRESEGRFRVTFEQAPIGISQSEIGGSYNIVNRWFTELLGYDESELVGDNLSFSDVTHPDDLDKSNEAVKQLETTLQPVTIEKRYVHKSGRLVWARTTLSLLMDEAGTPRYRIAIIEDITDRKHIEAAIRNIVVGVSAEVGERFFDSMVIQLAYTLEADYTLIGRLKTDENGSYMQVISFYDNNEITNDITYQIEETPTRVVLEKGVHSYPRDVQQHFPTNTNLAEMNAEGFTGVALHDSHNEPIGVMIAIYRRPIDNTNFAESVMQIFAARTAAEIERVTAEKSLRESERRFQHMLANLHLIAVMLDLDGNVTFINDYWSNLSGWSRAEALGKNWFDLFVADLQNDLTDIKDVFQKIRTDGEIPLHYENAIRTRSGETRLVFWNNTVLRDAQGHVIGTASIGQDVTERERAERVRQVMFNIADAVHTTHGTTELFEVIERELSQIIDTTNLVLGLYNPENNVISVEIMQDEHEAFQEIPVESSLSGQVIRRNQSLLLDEADIHRLVEEGSVKRLGAPAKVWLGVPLRVEGQVLGLIIVQNYHDPAAFSRNDLELLEFVSRQVAVSISKKQAEVQIRKLSRSVEQSPVSVIITDLAGRIDYVNPRFEEVSGYTFEEVKGKTPRLLKSGHTDPAVYEIMWEALTNGREWRGELCNRSKDGKLFWEFATISPIKDEQGKATHYLAVKEDMTRRKEWEETLRLSEEKFASIFRTSPSAISISRVSDSVFVEVNETFVRISGYTREQVIGRTWEELDLIPKTGTREKMVHILETEGVVSNYEMQFKTRDGRELTTLLSLRPIMMASEPCILTIAHDISERKDAENALAAEKERLAVTLRSIGDGVITTDTNGRIDLINKVAENMTGWTQAEAQGQLLSAVFKIVSEHTNQPVENPVQMVMKSGKVIGLANHTVLIARDGTRRAIADSGAPIVMRDGTIVGVVLVFRDVTEARRLEQAKRNFTNAISHELRTPLTPIYGYAEMIAYDDASNDRQKNMAEQILQCVQREIKLVDELLAIARLENSAEVYEFKEMNAYSLFAEMADSTEMLISQLVRERYHTDQFQLTYHVEPELKRVMVNVHADRIRHVVDNLISNAVKYSSPDRISLQFQARLEHDHVQVSICDSGRGIPAEEQSKIFDPYYQIRKSHDDISDGIGQGLTIVQRYIQRHGGQITVESQPGVGSCFIFTLPITKKEPVMQDGQQVVLVEDDLITAQYLGIFLSRNGFQVLKAKNGRIGLQHITENTPDVIILDLQLPDIEGREIIEHLEKQHITTPIIICSAQPQEKQQELVDRHPAVRDFIAKPFSGEDLLRKIHTVLSTIGQQ